ncbi:MAG TPA: hypothetical protein VNV16_11005 [Methylibium sp.]|nr:hypothetical protein [Methylibium sp.]
MAHKGQRICVMGGGPNLASDLERVQADIWISVNEHGARLRKADYVVAMDNTHTRLQTHMEKHLRQYTNAPIIGPWHWDDFQLMRWPLQPKFLLSGVIASWVATMMGSHPAILAGFDCYGGAQTNQHREYLPHLVGQVRVVSGPLTQFYKTYEAAETFGEYVPPVGLDIEGLSDGEIVVRVLKNFEFRGREWPPGTMMRASRYEVRRQIKHKSLEVVE